MSVPFRVLVIVTPRYLISYLVSRTSFPSVYFREDGSITCVFPKNIKLHLFVLKDISHLEAHISRLFKSCWKFSIDFESSKVENISASSAKSQPIGIHALHLSRCGYRHHEFWHRVVWGCHSATRSARSWSSHRVPPATSEDNNFTIAWKLRKLDTNALTILSPISNGGLFSLSTMKRSSLIVARLHFSVNLCAPSKAAFGNKQLNELWHGRKKGGGGVVNGV